MFLALINDTYSQVKAELSAYEYEKLIEDYLKKGYVNVLGKLGDKQGQKPQQILNAIQSAYNDDENVTYAELRQNLKKSNFSDVEIELFMSQYDTNENEEIDESEAMDVFQDISKGKQITGVHKHFKFSAEVSKIPPPNDADIEK